MCAYTTRVNKTLSLLSVRKPKKLITKTNKNKDNMRNTV